LNGLLARRETDLFSSDGDGGNGGSNSNDIDQEDGRYARIRCKIVRKLYIYLEDSSVSSL